MLKKDNQLRRGKMKRMKKRGYEKIKYQCGMSFVL